MTNKMYKIKEAKEKINIEIINNKDWIDSEIEEVKELLMQFNSYNTIKEVHKLTESIIHDLEHLKHLEAELRMLEMIEEA